MSLAFCVQQLDSWMTRVTRLILYITGVISLLRQCFVFDSMWRDITRILPVTAQGMKVGTEGMSEII